jgi:hypothetical protein
LIVHIGNASPQPAQMTRNFFTHNGLRKLAYLLDSSGKAPVEFYLFGKFKNQLIGRSIEDEMELWHEVMEILGSISTSELQAVFRNWMKRLKRVIETQSE